MTISRKNRTKKRAIPVKKHQGDALGTTDKATVVEVRVGKTPVEPLRILRGQCDALRSY